MTEKSAIDSSKRHMARGLQTARRIEATHGFVRGVRRWAKEAPGTTTRTKTRAKLKRLMEVLERLQQQVLAHGVTEVDAAQIEERLAQIESGLSVFRGTPSKSALKELGVVTRDQRKLTGRLIQV